MRTQVKTFNVVVDARIAWVSFDHPPINFLDIEMIREIDQLTLELEADPGIQVVVFQSADPDFFIAHADVELIRQIPTDAQERMAAFMALGAQTREVELKFDSVIEKL